MTIYDELVARGLIAQVTDEEEIKDLINNGKATFYIGYSVKFFIPAFAVITIRQMWKCSRNWE